MKKFLLAIFLIGLILTACSFSQQKTPVIGTWIVVSYGLASNPTPTLPNLDRSIIFDDDGNVSGNMGCNSFSGAYKIEGAKLTFQPMTSTKLNCPSDLVMKQEQAALQVLSGSADFKIDGKYLTITNSGNVLVMQVGGN